MKNLNFILPVLFVFISVVTSGQQQNKLTIGISAGPNRSFIYDHVLMTDKYFDPIISPSAGMYVQYNLPKIISFLSGVYYETAGRQQTGIYSDATGKKIGDYKFKVLLNYITLPLLAKITFGKKNGFFVEGGGFASYLVNGRNYYTLQEVKGEGDITESFKKMNFGVSAGLGVNISLTQKILLSIQGRNNLGLSGITLLGSYNKRTTNSTAILVGLAYKLGKRTN